MVKLPQRTVLAVSVSLVLVGCGGGGGGGGGGAFGPTVGSGSSPVSSYWTKVGTVKPLSGTAAPAIETSLYSYDIDATGGEELILTGRINSGGATAATWQDFNISIWGWSGGQLVDKTNQWFGNLNRAVVGTEEQVLFGDFDGDGHRDMYAGPYTDSALRAGTELSGTGAVFFNSGSSSFDRRVDVTLANPHSQAQAHGSAVADLDGDGIDDIWSTAGGGTTVLLGNTARTFTALNGTGNPQAGGSGVGIADFITVGTKSVILVDQGTAKSVIGSMNNLYTYTIDRAAGVINLTHFSALPTPRFELPKWTGQGFTGGHDVRVLADIQLSTGKTASTQGVISDAVIFSRANQYDVGHPGAGGWPELSEIQFLLNQGAGTFTDITDTVLKGYDTNTVASYNPTFKDVNNDGRLDIVIPGNSWTSNTGSQVLIWRSSTNSYGFEYQSSYAVMLQSFQDGVKALESNSNFGATGIALVQDPNGNLYVAASVSTAPDGTINSTHKSIYITPLNGLDYNQTRSIIASNWPWLSTAQIDAIMSQSTRTYLGLNLLDPTTALSPRGNLSISTASGFRPINGAISGLDLGGAVSSLQVLDGFGRAFSMDYNVTKIDMINTWSSRYSDQSEDTKSTMLAPNLQLTQHNGIRYGASQDNRSKVFGIPDFRLGDNLSGTVQFTNLPYSPWLSLSGSWGTVRSTSTVESTVKWQQSGWIVRGGSMYTTTDLDAGLVTKINPITAVWGDVSYQFGEWMLSGGSLPKIISGSADLTLPTSIDYRGQIQYTNMRVGFDNPTVGFARLGYRGKLNKNTAINIGGMLSSNDAYAMKMEIKSDW